MGTMASQIPSLTIVHSTVYSDADQTKTSKLRVTGLWADNSPVTWEFPAQMVSNAENASIWWRHHEVYDFCKPLLIQQRWLITYMLNVCCQVMIYMRICVGINRLNKLCLSLQITLDNCVGYECIYGSRYDNIAEKVQFYIMTGSRHGKDVCFTAPMWVDSTRPLWITFTKAQAVE